MVANELLLIVIPHIILIFWPDTDARYVLFVSNLVKGLALFQNINFYGEGGGIGE
jgi:hypothetical protein